MNNFNKDKIDVGELINKAKNSKNLDTNEGLNDFINRNLSKEQASAVKNLLQDEEKTKAVIEGSCGEECKFLFNVVGGEMIIIGSGEMFNYNSPDEYAVRLQTKEKEVL